MSQAVPAFPQASSNDPEEVSDALDTGLALWHKGDKSEALRWLRRARDFADEAGNDLRALELARVAADLSPLASTPTASTPTASTPTASTPTASSSTEQRRSKLPEPPVGTKKFTSVTETATTTIKPQLSVSASTSNQAPSLRPAVPAQRTSTVPRPQDQDRSSVAPRTEGEPGLISVSVRIAGIESDGSLRVYPVGQNTTAAPSSQGILVLSEKLWSTLNRR